MDTREPTRTPPKAPPMPGTADVSSEAELPESLSQVRPEVRDGFSLKILNQVLKSLRQILVLKPDRSSEIAVMRDAPAGSVGTPEGNLTLFEKVFLARFRGGAPLGEELPKGRACFLEKPENQWLEFFRKFLPFTVERKARASDVEALIYRGLVKGGASTAQVVSDLRFLSGKTEKFARVDVQDPEAGVLLSRLAPGERVTPDLFSQTIRSEDFPYLAISHRIENPETARLNSNPVAESYQAAGIGSQGLEGSLRETPGIALSARTEQLMAERLDINPRGRKRARDSSGDLAAGGAVFVPWFQRALPFKKYSGKPRWWVGFLYFIGISATGLAAYAVLRFLAH